MVRQEAASAAKKLLGESTFWLCSQKHLEQNLVSLKEALILTDSKKLEILKAT